MEKRKHSQKHYNRKPRGKNNYSQKKQAPSRHEMRRRKIKEFMTQYGMDEGAALEVAYGIVPLEIWLQKENNLPLDKIASEKLASLGEDFSVSAEFGIEILSALYSTSEYINKNAEKFEVEKKILLLSQTENLPIVSARKIIENNLTLEEFQKQEKERENRKEKAVKLHEDHPDIPLGTCYQIIDEGVSVEDYQNRKETRKRKREEWYGKYLEDHSEDNRELAQYLQKLRSKTSKVFCSFSQKNSIIGTILGFTPHKIKIKTRDQTIEYNKLEMKYLCRATHIEKLLSDMNVDEKLQENIVIPDEDPEKRYEIPPEILQGNKEIELILGGGEIFTGKIIWAKRYDIKLLLSEKPRTSVIIFSSCSHFC